MKVEFFRHSITEEDIARVSDVLRSLFLTTGKETETFEKELALYLGIPHVIGITSCTAALHLSLLAWGIQPGDEVITTPMSYCATANAILHAGATPVFVDIEEETGNIRADLIESKITEKTKAILPVHLYGQMCDMKNIHQIADQHRLVIIEDAAHCIEGNRDGIRVGELGDAACFSFYATKTITSGEGGAIATQNFEKAALLNMLRLHGINKSAANRYAKQEQHWDMPVLGWKYNMNNIQAALLRGQLVRIEELWKRREGIVVRYEEAFSEVEPVTLMKTVPNSRHARHLFTIQVAKGKRGPILTELKTRGIGVTVNYKPIHLLTYYRKQFGYKPGDFPVAEDLGSRILSLPLYPSLQEQEIEYVIRTVIEVVSAPGQT